MKSERKLFIALFCYSCCIYHNIELPYSDPPRRIRLNFRILFLFHFFISGDKCPSVPTRTREYPHEVTAHVNIHMKHLHEVTGRQVLNCRIILWADSAGRQGPAQAHRRDRPCRRTCLTWISDQCIWQRGEKNRIVTVMAMVQVQFCDGFGFKERPRHSFQRLWPPCVPASCLAPCWLVGWTAALPVITPDFSLEFAGFFPREKSRKTREISGTSREKFG